MSRKLSICEIHNTPYRRQLILIGSRTRRRNSAPEYLENRPLYRFQPFYGRQLWLRSSKSDLSVLIDDQTESGSSLELDTSALSQDLSPASTPQDDLSVSSRRSYPNTTTFDADLYQHSADSYSIRNTLCTLFIWKKFFFSHIVAACMTGMILSNNAPGSHSDLIIGKCFANYILLCLFWTTQLAIRNEGRGILQVLKLSGFRYALLSILHVEANYFLFSSFRQHSFLGNQTTDSIAALLSLILSYVCLEVQYQFMHVSGFLFTMLGAIGFCTANTFSKEDDAICWGDILRIGSGVFLALNNLAQELIVKSIDSIEYLGMIGLLGSFISGFQMLLTTGEQILLSSSDSWLFNVTFSLLQFIYSCLAPRLLREIGTTGLHLTLMTSEFYAYCANGLVINNQFQLFLFSYALVLCGCYIFVIKPIYVGTHYFFPVKVVIPKESDGH